MNINRKLLFGIALLSTVGLGGCAVESVPDGSNDQKALVFSESPNPTMKSDKEADEAPSLTDNWVQLSENSIELTMHGSSSCPPAVERVFKEEPSTVTVELKEKDADIVCTADYTPFYVTVVGTGDVEDVQLLLEDGSLKVLVAAGDAEGSTQSNEPVEADPNATINYNRIEVRTIPAPKPEPAAVPETPQMSLTPVPVVTPPASVPVAPVSNPVPAPAPAPAPVNTSGVTQEWIQATMAKYGVYPDAGTKFMIGPMPAGCEGAHGCTEHSYDAATGKRLSDYTITLVPGVVSEYLLFHEIGHARGIGNECEADNFARSVLGPVPGFYC